MSDNDDQAPVVRPLEQLQKTTAGDTGKIETTRKTERGEAGGNRSTGRTIDIVYAATDGLASVSPEGMAATLENNIDQSAAQIATALLVAVNETRKPQQDNTTVAVIRHG